MALYGVFLPRRWRRQPLHPIEVDWSNGLARGIVHLQTAYGLIPNWTNIGTTTSRTICGDSRSFASASTQYFHTTSRITSFPLTFGALIIRATVSANQAVLGLGGSTGHRHLLYCSSANAAIMYSNGASAASATTPGSAIATVGRCYNVVGSVASATQRNIYLEGAPIASNTTSVTPTNLNTIVVGTDWTSGAPVAGLYFNGSIPLSVVWDRVLLDAEVLAFYENPWQIFLPKATGIFFSIPSGAVTKTFAQVWGG